MAEVRLSTYSSLTSGLTNWSPAVIAAKNALVASSNKGGRLIMDVLRAPLLDPIPVAIGEPLLIEGDGANAFILGDGSKSYFNFSNNPDLRLLGLCVYGDDTSGAGATQDCANAFSFGSNLEVSIEHCKFAGIKASGAVIKATSGNVFRVKDCNLSGNGGNTVLIEGVDSFDADNLAFIDYLVVNGQYRSKVAESASWIVVQNPPSGVVGARTTRVDIRGSRFDEASAEAIHIDGYQHVNIEQPRVNVGSYGYAIAINILNVERSRIFQPHIGYNNADRPICQFTGGGVHNVIQAGRDSDPASPYRITRDGDTIVFNVQPKSGVLIDSTLVTV